MRSIGTSVSKRYSRSVHRLKGLEEIQRKRIELKHNLISLLSGKGEEELEDPLRAEKLRNEILLMANEKVLKRSEVIDVFITSMELE